MFKWLAPRDLSPIAAAAAVGLLTLALFGWAERAVVVDPDGVHNWGWKVWQLGALAVGVGGVWWLWLSTRRVAWIRSLALGIMALVVLLNGYGDLFGDYWAEVFRVHNPLFIGCASVAAVVLWRNGSPMARLGAVASAAVGIFLFLSFNLLINEVSDVVWQILKPLRMVVDLAWAAGAASTGIAKPEGTT
ncbi:MAG: DUF4175 domain-containing protein [Chloroflexi bacterium]|nr:DUF4175 domain-containing protein [Chloroflexota bacterium]MYD47701.1 DUF4175 domain-containing protein [Chloroflexota bacterium]